MINYHYNGIVPSVTASWSSYYAVNGYHIATSTSSSSHIPAPTSTSAPTSTPAHSGPSAAAKAGIGVGVAVVVVVLVSLLFLLLRGQQRKRQKRPGPAVTTTAELAEEVPLTTKRIFKSELSGETPPTELDAKPQEEPKVHELQS